MIIIAIDPGLVTGMAISRNGETPAPCEVPYADFGTVLKGWISVNQWPRASLVVVCEKYVMTPGIKSSQPEALMLMGVTEFLCQQYGVKLVWQFPRDAKKMCPDSFLRQAGWYQKTKDGHANDAMRHVGLWMAHNQPEEFAKLIGI
jgi:hypothetical protein